jgi:hypothetical protein
MKPDKSIHQRIKNSLRAQSPYSQRNTLHEVQEAVRGYQHLSTEELQQLASVFRAQLADEKLATASASDESSQYYRSYIDQTITAIYSLIYQRTTQEESS